MNQQDYKNNISRLESASEKIAYLEKEIRYHNRMYYDVGSGIITDHAYDYLWDTLKELNPDSPVLTERGTVLKGDFPQVKHQVAMGSLSKCKTVEEVLSKFSGHACVVTPKIDGAGLAIRYKNGRLHRGITRGDTKTDIGNDITANVQQIIGVPDSIDCLENIEIRGEAFIDKKDFYGVMDQPGFAGSEKGMANPRNAASGALMQKDISKIAERKLQFVAYKIIGGGFETYSEQLSQLVAWGFQVPRDHAVIVRDKDILQSIIDKVQENCPQYPYEIDGAVIRINNESDYQDKGWSSKCPNGAIAYKYDTEKSTSTVLDIEWTASRTGRINPVALIEPTLIAGSTVGRITLNNIEWIEDLDIAIGDKILFEKANEIIPRVVDVINRSDDRTLPIPESCPTCKSSIAREGKFLICNNSDCSAKIIERTLHMLVKLNIKGVAESTVTKMFEANLITLPWEIFDLTKEDLIGIGLGEKQSENIVKSLSKRDVSPYDFMASLGIHMWGREMFEILTANSSVTEEQMVDGLIDVDLESVRGIGPEKGSVLREAIPASESQLSTFQYEMLKQLREKVNVVFSEAAGDSLEGKSFCLSGTLSKDRKAVADEIKSLGGTIKSSVTKNLDYLVAGPGSGSKSDKANDLGVTVLTEEELRGMM